MRRLVTFFLVILLLGAAAAPAAAQSLAKTEEMLSGMVTEEVEPGVVRVVADGVREVTITDAGSPNSWLAITPDDAVWIFGETRAYRLGDTAEYAWEDNVPWAYESGPDGTLWGITFDSAIVTFDGDAWTEQGRFEGRQYAYALAVAPDGTAWVTASDESECPTDSAGPDCARTSLSRVDQTGLSTVESWQEADDGRLGLHPPVIGPGGDVWLVGVDDEPPWWSVAAFLGYDGSAWRRVDVPDGLDIAIWGESFAFAPDGTLWSAVASSGAVQQASNDGLARLDESGWTVFTEADGVRPWGGQFWVATDYLRVSPDGNVWVNAVDSVLDCDGVASFDGTRWTPYLSGYCIDDYGIASDGSVWALASEDYDDPVHLYVITPGPLMGAG